MPTVTFRLGPSALGALARGRAVVLRADDGAAGAARAGATGPRAGSHADRILKWADLRATPFRTVDVATALALSRGHASVLLGKLAGDGLERIGRGLYRHATASAAPREGSLPARILAWATRRGKPFGIGDVRRRFRLTDGHAGMLLSKLASGPHAIRRARRGLYEAH
jgi:hypothetical protein